MDDGRKVHRRAVVSRALEPNLLCSAHRGFIQSISQSPQDADHLNLAGGVKIHLKEYFALQAQAPRFLSINRPRLEENLQQLHGRRCTPAPADDRAWWLELRSPLLSRSRILRRPPTQTILSGRCWRTCLGCLGLAGRMDRRIRPSVRARHSCARWGLQGSPGTGQESISHCQKAFGNYRANRPRNEP